VGDKDHGIRYYGVPAGYEFAGFLEDLIMSRTATPACRSRSRGRLKALEHPLHLQVFVTPTCPYCPGAVRLAHQFAMESDLVTADMVEATEFPDLSKQVHGDGRAQDGGERASRGGGHAGRGRVLDAVLSATE